MADFAGPGEGEVDVVVEPGQTGEDIASTLRDAGVVKSRSAYLEVADGDPKRAATIQPGTYVLPRGCRPRRRSTRSPTRRNRDINRTTVREGLWASETFALLSKESGIPVKEYVKAAKDTEAIGLPKEAEGQGRGLAAPSSYEFPEKATATEQLKAMVAQTVKALDDAGVEAKDRQKVLTLASPGRGRGQARRGPAQDRPGVPQPHRDRGPPANGLIQSDAAVSYGAKRRSLFPSKAELDDASNPYNTRIHPGLPPGPISNPGAASIEAAANPADGPWFFFVAVNPITGETKYGDDPGRAQRQRRRAQRLLRGQTAGLRSVRAAVLGSPITHSLSPVLHRAGYRAAGLSGWEYDAHEVDADGLAAFVGGPG